MSAASSDTESSCGWTIISNEVLNLSYVRQIYLTAGLLAVVFSINITFIGIPAPKIQLRHKIAQ